MTSETAFVVQVYREVGRGRLRADLPFNVASAGSARMRAEMIAPHVAGVIAYQNVADPGGGMRREMLARYGRQPESVG